MSSAERRRSRRIASASVLAVVGLLVGYGTAVEPYWLEVSRHDVEAPVRTPLVVAHLSDLHTHGFGPREKQVVEILQRERPDLVVVTGDLVDDGDLTPVRELFANLHAPLGIWVVRGNWENWRPPPSDRDQLASFGATLLVNEGRLVRPDVWLLGLDDAISGSADVAAAVRDAPSDAARIAIFHSPDVFENVAAQIDLALAGHTHGGQVRIPLFGAVWTPPGSGSYVAGWYAATSTSPALASPPSAPRGSARMFVSRGIGTSVLPVRFACRPEVAIVNVRPPH